MQRSTVVTLFTLIALCFNPTRLIAAPVENMPLYEPHACTGECVQPCAHGETYPRERYWRLSVMPYLWAASLKGSITAKGIPTQVDVGFSDIFDALDYAVIGQIEVARGRCFILADTLLMKTTIDASAEKTALGPLGLVEIQGEADVNLETLVWFQEVLAGYRLCERNLCSCPDHARRFSFDLLGGIRYYLVDVDLNASAQVNLIGPGGGVITRERSASASQTEDWIDPVIGARMQYDLTHRLAIILKGDVGGFGVGSDFAWSASALAKYQLCDHWSILGGYKVLDIDYENGLAGMDARMAGPVAGVQYEIKF